MFQFTQMEIYELNQLRIVLPAETTGHLDTAELSIEYHGENLKHIELWVRVAGDNVRGMIRVFEAENKNTASEDFHQSLITQVNMMPDIDDYIDAWIYRRQKEAHKE